MSNQNHAQLIELLGRNKERLAALRSILKAVSPLCSKEAVHNSIDLFIQHHTAWLNSDISAACAGTSSVSDAYASTAETLQNLQLFFSTHPGFIAGNADALIDEIISYDLSTVTTEK